MSIFKRPYQSATGLVNGMRLLIDSYGIKMVLTVIVGILFERQEPEQARHVDRCLITLPDAAQTKE